MNRFIAFFIAGAALLALGIVIGWQLPYSAPPSVAKPERAGLQPAYRAGSFRIGVAVQPHVPKVGENRLTVVLENKEGKPISGVRIHAVAEMPAMGSMAAMRVPVEMREVKPGLYWGILKLPVEGSWPLTLRLAKSSVGKARLVFNLATGRQGLELVSGARPLNTAKERPADNDRLPYRAGPYRFDVVLKPKTPVVGKNIVVIYLQNKQGQPIEAAQIEAMAKMPAMGSMPTMQIPAKIKEVKPGVYGGLLELPMEGRWFLTLQFKAADAPERKVVLDMTTGRSGLTVISGAVRADGGGEVIEAALPGTVTLNARRRQLIGVETAQAKVTDLVHTIRAVGQIVYDETRLTDVNLKFNAWIGELFAEYVGAQVEQGQPLLTVYSPALLAAQQEYLELQRRGTSPTLLDAARKRLKLWDMTAETIAALERQEESFDYVPIHAPRTGTVVTKNVVEGTAIEAGETLMRIANLSQVWVEAAIYEGELPLVREGMTAVVTLPYLPSREFEATVDYVYPYLSANNRTGKVRLSLPNPDGLLKPGMYAEVKLRADLGTHLTVPEEAVIIAGETRIVFEDLGNGRLAPRRVETGQRADGRIEILSGLEAGDIVVTSGNFLIASESRLKGGIERW